MRQYRIPNAWKEVKLGDITDYGKTQKCELSDVPSDTWVLELEDIEKDSSRILKHLDSTERPFKSTKNKFSVGDVLYGKLRPYLNKVVIANNSGVCSTEIIPLNVEPHIDNRFLFYWLKSKTFLDFVNSVSYGVNMPRLGTKDGLLAPFILAPLAEQKVIADKLDTLLAQVETTKARLERIPEILKTFRQSVLTAAVNGKLTEEWRGSQQGLFDWKLVELKDAANIIDPHPSHRTPKAVEGGVPYIGIGDLRDDGSIDFDNSRKVSSEVLLEHKARYSLKAGDFVFGKIGTLGKATTLPVGIDYTLSANVILIQPIESLTTPKYLQFFLSSPSTMDDIVKQANSTSQAAFGIKKMRTFKCKLPSKEEQVEITRRVEELFAFADSIEQKTNAALERVNKLTQSILAKAFRGELTADWRTANPELISGENSAEALLEKIKAEREALKSKPKPKRSTVKKKTGSRMNKKIIKVTDALKQAGKPLTGQLLLVEAGYPSDSSTDLLEQFFLDIREALTVEKSIVQLERQKNGQDVFALADKEETNKATR